MKNRPAIVFNPAPVTRVWIVHEYDCETDTNKMIGMPKHREEDAIQLAIKTARRVLDSDPETKGAAIKLSSVGGGGTEVHAYDKTHSLTLVYYTVLPFAVE